MFYPDTQYLFLFLLKPVVLLRQTFVQDLRNYPAHQTLPLKQSGFHQKHFRKHSPPPHLLIYLLFLYCFIKMLISFRVASIFSLFFFVKSSLKSVSLIPVVNPIFNKISIPSLNIFPIIFNPISSPYLLYMARIKVPLSSPIVALSINPSTNFPFLIITFSSFLACPIKSKSFGSIDEKISFASSLLNFSSFVKI